ncbi:putative hydrolase [Cercophora samala]|uniref:Hydrolase n=1 Tax=Cercophora samala TaxID=330535 RepID=A0AA39ZK95_9PEZI|nr:putative hydrolase [Cercophora samala]
MAPPSPNTSLSFTSWNDNKPTTIVLLHGGFTCRLEFALVLPHLSDFHLLVPDLPLHSASRHVKPGTTDNSARHVAQLIQSHAHGGKAHVVGVSMGGYIAQCLALDNPDIVLSLFVTGAAPASGARLFMAQWPALTYYSMKMMLGWVPGWWYQWQASLLGLKLDLELIEEMKGNITWEVVQDMFPWILSFGLDDVRRLKVRTLHIAGAKGDDVGMMVRTAEALRDRKTEQGGVWPEDGSGGFVLREGVHGWDMQFPELFADGVRVWVEGGSVLEQFERV